MSVGGGKRKRASSVTTKKSVARPRKFKKTNRLTRMPAAMVGFKPEVKSIDIPFANYPFREPATASSIQLLNGVQVGAGFNTRVGSRIEMKNLHVRGFVNNKATSAVSFGRMLIVYDRQPNGVVFVIADLLKSRDNVGTAATTGSSEINLDNRDRFIIVRNEQFYFPPVTNTAGVLTNGPSFPGQTERYDVNLFIPLAGLVTLYNGTSNPAVIGDINSGALFAVFVSQTVDNTWQAGLGFRLRYKDTQ